MPALEGLPLSLRPLMSYHASASWSMVNGKWSMDVVSSPKFSTKALTPVLVLMSSAARPFRRNTARKELTVNF